MTALWTPGVLPPPDREMILRFARGGHTPQLDALLNEVIGQGSAALDPRLCYADLPLTLEGERVALGGLPVPGRDLAAHLKGCRRAVLFAATVGAGADRLITRAERTSPARALLLDAFFSERVEALCDAFCAQYNDPRRRFSPGYGDLPLSFQREVFRLLDCPRLIGLTLGETLLMMPTKSVTAIVGVKEDDR